MKSEDFAPSIGMSDFAAKRHCPGRGHSYTLLTTEHLIDLVRSLWHNRVPGRGETGLFRKVVIPITCDLYDPYLNSRFRCPSALLTKDMKLKSEVGQRQEGEDLFVKTYLRKSWWDKIKSFFGFRPEPEVPTYISVVCYSKEALLENGGTRSTDCEWEIVALLCSPVENEPMHPLTMARNYLQMPGGTKSDYTAQEFAESIYYWSKRINIGN